MSNEPDDPEDDFEEQPETSARNAIVGMAIVVEGGLIALAWLLGWLVDVPATGRLNYDWRGLGLGLLATVPMLAVFFVMVRWPIGPFRSIKRFTDETIRPMMSPCTLLDLAGISILAGLGEELLFRGVIQEAWVGWLGVWGAIAASAILFGLLHAVTPTYAVVAALIGAYLGAVFYFSENLLTVVVAHAVYDFCALLWVMRGPGSEVAQVAEDQVDNEADAP